MLPNDNIFRNNFLKIKNAWEAAKGQSTLKVLTDHNEETSLSSWNSQINSIEKILKKKEEKITAAHYVFLLQALAELHANVESMSDRPKNVNSFIENLKQQIEVRVADTSLPPPSLGAKAKFYALVGGAGFTGLAIGMGSIYLLYAAAIAIGVFSNPVGWIALLATMLAGGVALMATFTAFMITRPSTQNILIEDQCQQMLARPQQTVYSTHGQILAQQQQPSQPLAVQQKTSNSTVAAEEVQTEQPQSVAKLLTGIRASGKKDMPQPPPPAAIEMQPLC